MGVVYLSDSILSDIADAIRYKENSSNIYYPNQMGMAIRNLNGGGGGEVDRALIPDMNFPNYNLNIVRNVTLVNELPDDAIDVYRCDIGDASISKPAYAFKNGVTSSYDLGIYSPVNSINSISILNMAYAFNNSRFVLQNGATICGDLTTDMSYTFNGCQGLTGSPYIGRLVKRASYAYNGCSNITGYPSCGDFVEEFTETYRGCIKLSGSPVCGNNVINMSGAYQGCNHIMNDPICGPNVINMAFTYYGCTNLTGNPVCGVNVTNMVSAYYGCVNLLGNPVAGSAVINMASAYVNCYNLVGNAVFSPLQQPISFVDGVGYFTSVYANCRNLSGINIPNEWTTMANFALNANWYQGTAECGVNVVTMTNAYRNCFNLIGNAVFGESVSRPQLVDYYFCNKLTGIEIKNNDANMYMFGGNQNWYKGDIYCPPNTTNFYGAYYNMANLTASPICGDKVTNMAFAYYHDANIVGNAVCGNNVINMHQTYAGCYNLTGESICGDNVIDFSSAYYECRNIIGNPVCGENVQDMASTYSGCYNLTGEPVCGDYVTTMGFTYANCNQITGNPVIGPNVISMYRTYWNCTNLTGQPVLHGWGNYNNGQIALTNTSGTYYNCVNLTGYPVPGGGDMSQCYYNCQKLDMGLYPQETWQFDRIMNMSYTFYNCPNIYGNIALLNKNSAIRTQFNMYLCFYGRDNSRMLNINVFAGYGWNNWIYNVGQLTSTTKLTWTMDSANHRYYNTVSNIYVYYN